MSEHRRPMSSPQFRALFPSLSRMIHVASCSFAPPSTPLIEAQAAMMAQLESGEAPWHFYEARIDEVRQRFAEIIGAPAGNVALMPNASTGAFQAASTIDWQERTGIVASALDFPSLAHVWHQVASDVRLIEPAPDGGIQVEEYLTAIDAGTGLVSIPLATYRTGARAGIDDINAIAERAHEVGARVIVDGYQAIGVVPCDVDELRCDFLVGGSMKFLLGLPGVAYLYVREPTQGREPRLTGWFGRVNPFAFDPRAVDFPDEARRFETGTPQFPLLVAAAPGLELIAGLDRSQVWRHVSDLVDHATSELDSGELPVLTAPSPERRGPMVALQARDGDHANAQADHLAANGVVASPRGDVVRLTFHYFNDHDDVDAIVKALRS